MAAQTVFVTGISGQWFPLCEYRDGRKSLIIQAADLPIVIGFKQAPASIVTAFGTIPPGLFAFVDQFIGPTEFRFTSALDADLVKQEWFGWIATMPAPGPPLQANIFQAGANPTTAVIVINVPALIAVISLNAGPGAVVPTLISSIVGPVAPLVQLSIPGDVADTGWLVLWAWLSPIGTDNLTLTPALTDNVAAFWWSFDGDLADTGGSGLATPVDITMTTAAPVAAIGEFLLASVVATGDGEPYTWPVQWTTGGANLGFASADGTLWSFESAYANALALTQQSVVVAFGSPLNNGAGFIQAWTLLSGQQTTGVVTVIESFDEAKQPSDGAHGDVGTFEYVYPQLSPDGLKALRELMGRAQQ